MTQPRTRQNAYPVGPGGLLIVNQREFTVTDPGQELKPRTPGTDVDRDNLLNVFGSLGYKSHVVDNCDGDAFEGHLKTAVDKIGDGVGPFVLALLTHGNSKGLFFADGKQKSIMDIRRMLTNHEKLVGRPKIFLVQACRGREHLADMDKQGPMIMLEDEDFQSDYAAAVDPMGDTVILYSCIEERVSYLHTRYGSMFITFTCEVVLENMKSASPTYTERDLLHLSTKINAKIGELRPRYHGYRMLTSSDMKVSAVRKDLFLGPPVHMDTFRTAKARIQQLVLKLRLGQGGDQVVSNLQVDDVHRGPGCNCMDRCASSSTTCPCRRAGSPCGPQCRHPGGPNTKCTNAPRATPCQCTKGCDSNRCGCRKNDAPCGERCHPGGPACENQIRLKGMPGPSSSSRASAPSATTPVASGARSRTCSRACSCKKGCGTYRCGCRGAGLACSPACHGGAAAGCQNDDSFLEAGVSSQPPQQRLATDDDDGLALAAGVSGAAVPSGKGCSCQTDCGSRRCGCVKEGVPCSTNCHGGRGGDSCKNRRTPPAASGVNSRRSQPSDGTKEKAKSSALPSGGRGRRTDDEETDEDEMVCGCKTGCATNRCGCRKENLTCSSRCHGGTRCQNESESDQEGRKSEEEESSSRTSAEGTETETESETETDEDEVVCDCKNDCATNRCGCRKENLTCSSRCRCGPRCQNDSESEREGGESGEEVVCGCKTGCATNRCGCRKGNSKCSSRCHGGSPCENLSKPGKAAASAEKSKAATGGSVKTGQPSAQAAPAGACACQTGCARSNCSCRKAARTCGPRCHRGAGSDCMNRSKESGAGEKTVRCQCKTGCLLKKCSCRSADVSCGPRCHPSHSDQCKNN